MGDAPKRIEQEPLYPCCQCYDEYSWPKEDLRWYKNDLWCANCFDELDEDGERMLWSDLEPFVPKCDRELAASKADRVAISQRLSDALDALFASNNQLAEARAEIERKDKLIEQMRGALTKLIGTLEVMSVMPETLGKCPVLAIDAPELEQARAALAAERGGE